MLDGRQIVLAGGCGGLGSVSARLLAAEGAEVTASYKDDRARCEALADVATVLRCDLAEPADRQALLDQAPNLYGVAVFSGHPARIADTREKESSMLRSHETNFLGPMLLAQEAAERMGASETAGSIVLISSMQAVSLFAGSTAYAAQKAALIHGARILAKECRGRRNIRVNVVCPGVTRAGMAQASIASGKYNRYLEQGAISRFGEAEDVARAVRFFLEPDNYITGQVLTVDGGLTL